VIGRKQFFIQLGGGDDLEPGGGLDRAWSVLAAVLAVRLATRCLGETERSVGRRPAADTLYADMPPFMFICPNTGFRVQGFAPEQTSDDDGERFEAIECILCKRTHVVNPATGEVLGQDGR
jgi:hypothetical protein